MRSPSEGTAVTHSDGFQGASLLEHPEGGGPGGRGDGADAELVNEVEERECRAECGAATAAEAHRSNPAARSDRASVRGNCQSGERAAQRPCMRLRSAQLIRGRRPRTPRTWGAAGGVQ